MARRIPVAMTRRAAAKDERAEDKEDKFVHALITASGRFIEGHQLVLISMNNQAGDHPS